MNNLHWFYQMLIICACVLLGVYIVCALVLGNERTPTQQHMEMHYG